MNVLNGKIVLNAILLTYNLFIHSSLNHSRIITFIGLYLFTVFEFSLCLINMRLLRGSFVPNHICWYTTCYLITAQIAHFISEWRKYPSEDAVSNYNVSYFKVPFLLIRIRIQSRELKVNALSQFNDCPSHMCVRNNGLT